MWLTPTKPRSARSGSSRNSWRNTAPSASPSSGQWLRGFKRISGAEIAVAVSGIAGPDGGTTEQPVGTVWFAWTGPAGTRAQVHRFEGERDTIRHDSVARALQGLLALLAAG